MPSTFDRDWGRGPVFSGRQDMLLLEATMTTVVSRPGWVWFEIGGDDGFELFIDGEKILDDWYDGSFRRWGRYRWMRPGIHELRLRYYEWTDRAELLFNTRRDILKWSEAVGCQEGDKPMLAASSSGTVVFDGAVLSGMGSGPSVVVLQGIDSKSSCEEVHAGRESFGSREWRNGELYQSPFAAPEPLPDSTFMRRNTLVKVLQDRLPGDWERDVLGFSYSGSYEHCDTGAQFSAGAYPVGNYGVFPKYDKIDTCGGVRNAATKLGSLLTSLHAREPSREIVLIGHSLGGMVAAYYAAELAPPEIRSKVASIVTIDSPLLGHLDRNPFSACPATAQSWQDIFGGTEIVRSINAIQRTDLAQKFVHMNSTGIGDYLDGARSVRLECRQELAMQFGLIGDLWGLLTDGHSCGFYDPEAFSEIVKILRQ